MWPTGLSPERIARYERNFATMLPWFPEKVENFLDIGSGTGGIALLVSKHFPDATVHLIDSETAQPSWTSYRADGEPWADVNAAKGLIEKGSGAVVHGYSPGSVKDLPACELIYSICSWGHHYSIDTYIDLVKRTLKPKGVLIVDLRKGRVGETGFEVLKRKFDFVAKAGEGKKYDRTVWMGPSTS